MNTFDAGAVQDALTDPLAYEALYLERLSQARMEKIFCWTPSASPADEGRLPWELVLFIFRMLDVSALCVAGRVNKDWQMLADSDVLWSRTYCQVFRNEIPLLTLAPFGNSWKRACKEIALLPVVGSRCSAETSPSNSISGTITRITQASQVGLEGAYAVQHLIHIGYLFPTIIPALSLRVVDSEPTVPFQFNHLKCNQVKANYSLKMKSRLAAELLTYFDTVNIDFSDEEWEIAFKGHSDQQADLMETARKRLLDSLIQAANKRVRTEEPFDDTDVTSSLKNRFWRRNESAVVQIKQSDLLDTKVMIPNYTYGEHYFVKGAAMGLTDDKKCLNVEADCVLHTTPINDIYLFSEESEAHKEMINAIVSGDKGIVGMEIFIPSHNNSCWSLAKIKEIHKPTFLFEITVDAGWTTWCPLSQLSDFASDLDAARSLFWKTVARAKRPQVDKSLFGRRMLIQNKSQNLGGRIIQAHSAGTIALESAPAATKVVYLYEKSDDLAHGNYKIMLQYQVKMELNQTINYVGAHQLYHFADTPPTISDGDRVLAEWRTGYWYVGTITHATAAGWHVSYDDGDQQDDVPEPRLMHLATSKYTSPFPEDEESSGSSQYDTALQHPVRSSSSPTHARRSSLSL